MGFRYTSENNDRWLDKDELMKIVEELEIQKQNMDR